MQCIWFARTRKRRVLAAAVVVFATATLVGSRWAYVTWQLRLARTALIDGDAETAVRILQRAERFQPDRAELLYLLGRAYRRAGRIDRALPYFDRAAQAGWSRQDLRHQRYLLLVQAGRFERAESYLKEVLRKGCSDELAEEVYEAQAKGYLKTYRLNDAIVCLNYWIQWRPGAVQPRLWLADVCERCDRWQSAADEYRAILQLHPDHHLARLKLAANLLRLNHVRPALAEYEACLKAEPDDVEALIGAAKCFRRLADMKRARQQLEDLLEFGLAPAERAEVLMEMGQIALESRDLPGAIELLRRATDIEPLNQLAHSSLAVALARIGEKELASKHRDRAERIKKQFDRLTTITGVLAKTPGNADLRWEAGMILMEQGLKKEGADWMSTALIFDPSHHETHKALAEYYAKIGSSELAAYHRSMTSDSRNRQPGENAAATDDPSGSPRDPAR